MNTINISSQDLIKLRSNKQLMSRLENLQRRIGELNETELDEIDTIHKLLRKGGFGICSGEVKCVGE